MHKQQNVFLPYVTIDASAAQSYAASCGIMINEMQRELKQSGNCLIKKLTRRLEGLRKTAKTLSEENRYLGRDSN
jgi:hypothetical protein